MVSLVVLFNLARSVVQLDRDESAVGPALPAVPPCFVSVCETLLELRGFGNGAHSVPAYMHPSCVGRFLRSAHGSIQHTVAIAVPFQRVGHGSLLFGG